METDIHFFITPRLVLLRMRNISDKRCRGKKNKYFICNNFYWQVVIMWKNIVDSDRPQMTIIQRMRIACWILRATSRHSECVILIVFPLQQWLNKRASSLYYTYIVCFVNFKILRYLFYFSNLYCTNHQPISVVDLG